MDKFKGMGVAMVTPFDAQKNVDYQALEKHTEHLVNQGTSYLVVMGTTGENPTISQNDQDLILSRVLEVNAGRIPVVFGIGGNNTEALKKRLSSAPLQQVDGILSVSPYYNKPNQSGILKHFTSLADVSSKPIILYNVPGRTGSMMHVDTILELARHEKIVAIKEASGSFDHVNKLLLAKEDEFLVISGDDAYTLPFIAMGMSGVISVVGNAFPKEFSQMVRYMLDGNVENARYLHYKLLPIMEAIFEDGNPGGIKRILNKMGFMREEFRMPVEPVNAEVAEKLDQLLAAF
jgi:4-hydroxy-tetrahydrodipicolinate synthase